MCCGSWGRKESDMTEQLNRTETVLAIFLFLFFFFLMWTVFKVFTELFKTLFLFHVLAFLAMRHVGSHAPAVGSLWEPAPPALEVLTTGPPGKSLCW